MREGAKLYKVVAGVMSMEKMMLRRANRKRAGYRDERRGVKGRTREMARERKPKNPWKESINHVRYAFICIKPAIYACV